MRAADFDRLAEKLYPAVLDAGLLEMQHFKTGVPIETKSDRSPVTVADREAEAIILAALTLIAPEVTVVAEEEVAAGNIPAPANEFFLVDALDGTRLFIRGKPEFSVNIGLVQNRRPVFGMIYVPPTGDLFFTTGDGRSVRAYAPWSLAERIPFPALRLQTLQAREPDKNNLKAFNSQTAGAAGVGLLTALNVKTAEPIGSSLKFCLIAAGEGDLYARLGETSEWDTAAGQAILEAAGGTVTIDGGTALSYGKSATNYRNPHFVAWARQPLIADFGRHQK